METKDWMALVLAFGVPMSTLAVASVINAQERHCRFERSWNFNGETLLVERCTGKLGLSVGKERVVSRWVETADLEAR